MTALSVQSIAPSGVSHTKRERPRETLRIAGNGTRGAAWPWPHAQRGSCQPGCPRYGYCHCKANCRRRPALARWNCYRDERWAGQPNVFVMGHNPRPGPGAWSRRGVPIERVRPLAQWLLTRYGGPQAAITVGLPHGTLQGVAYNMTTKRYVTPAVAQAVVDGVLLSRRSADPYLWSENEESPRLATEADSRLAKDIEHEVRSADTRFGIREPLRSAASRRVLGKWEVQL